MIAISSATRVALYARVSTNDQNCDLQLRELREYAAARKWEIAGEYVDMGWSGSKANRPELTRLMSDARKRRFDAVLVWKLDRWGRSVADSIRGITELTSLEVRFIAVTQNIDTNQTNPMARFLLHIMAAFSELERELIRERTVAGVRTARSKGKIAARLRGPRIGHPACRPRRGWLGSWGQRGRRWTLGACQIRKDAANGIYNVYFSRVTGGLAASSQFRAERPDSFKHQTHQPRVGRE
jgi:DNA invertase Pin-like site-specific DNA recombinase